MNCFRLHRLGRGLLAGSGPVAGLLLGWAGTGTLAAQTPPKTGYVQEVATQEAAPQRVYWKKNTIHLPVQINDQFKDLIKEVQLFVKDRPNAPWSMRDVAGPGQKIFTFHAPRDGEYYFTMVTVDKKGRCVPGDVRTEPPQLIVVIDTQAPELKLTNLGPSPEGDHIHFEVHDPNLDQAHTKLYFQGGDKQFRPMHEVPGRPNVFCVPAQAVCTGHFQAVAQDMAGNRTVVEGQISQLPAPIALDNPRTEAPLASQKPLAHQDVPQSNPDLPQAPRLSQETKVPAPVELIQPDPPKVLPKNLMAETQPKSGRVASRPDGSEGPRLLENDTKIIQTDNKVPQIELPVRKDLPKRQLVNQSRLFLDYQVENVGPSGVGKVEVWITRDQGKVWQKLSESSHGKSSVEVQLPGEGLFGITLVAANGRGLPGTPPSAGDNPDWLIEVDMTKPAAQITNVSVAKEHGETVVQVAWSSQDSNLGEGPVELYFSATMQGPWLSIAKGLKGDGQHRWTPPANIGSQAFVRMVVRDLAGNASICHTVEPIQFEDVTRPRAVIRSIRTEAP